MRQKGFAVRACFGVLSFFVAGSALLFASVPLDSLPSDYVLEDVYRTIGLENMRYTESRQLSSKTIPSFPLPAECFPLNSPGWLQSETRVETIAGDFLNDVFQSFIPTHTAAIQDSPPYQSALDQTICVDGSPFREGWKVSEEENANTIRFWTARLVYLSIAYHQHYPAFDEYRHRQTAPPSCEASRRKYKLSENDYECPTAKFLVYPLKEFGLGVNMKLGALMALRTAIATGRILLLVNGLEEVRSLRRPWPLVSCARKDFQCFFLPLSPCVPTKEELQRAPMFGGKEARSIYSRRGNFSDFMEHERVLIFPATHPTKEPFSFRQRLVNICHELIRKGIIPDAPVVHKALSRLLNTTSVGRSKKAEADYEIGGGILSYLMRPRPEFLQELQNIQRSLSTELKAETYPTMGLPIRGEYTFKYSSSL